MVPCKRIYFIFICTIANAVDASQQIIGGNVAQAIHAEWMVQLKNSPKNYICAGVLISSTHILTAAHCLVEPSPRINYLVVGMHTLQAQELTIQLINRTFIHPQYKPLVYDFGIIELTKPVDVKPISLRSSLFILEEKEKDHLMTFGWGYTYLPNENTGEKPFSKKLKSLEFQIPPKEECIENWKNMTKGASFSDEAEICAISKAVGQSICNGDSGGPLTTKEGHLLGITSSSSKACIHGKEKVPVTFARVSAAQDFIDKHSIGHKWIDYESNTSMAFSPSISIFPIILTFLAILKYSIS